MSSTRLTVITPTCDRPAGLALLERWMQRQTRQPDEWIVVDGGSGSAPCTRGQIQIYQPSPPGAENFCLNLLAGAAAASGDLIAIMEDDDWYAPGHLATLCDQLAVPGAQLAGDPLQRYYNLATRRWRIFHNKGASLCQTMFRRALLPAFVSVLHQRLRERHYGVDGAFWAGQPKPTWNLQPTETVVGMKGLPGQAGLGVGHRPGAGWTADPDLRQLRAWIGVDADVYAALGAPAQQA